MFKIFAIISLIIFQSFNQVNSLNLKSLCNERITRDGNYHVNSYYRLKLNKTLPAIEEYLSVMNLSEKFSRPKNISNLKKLIKDVYSEMFFNNSNLVASITEKRKEIEELRADVNRNDDYYRGRYFSHYLKPDFDNITLLLSNLTKLKDNYLTEDLLSVDDLRKELKMLKKLDQNQTSIFQNEFIDVFYEKELATFDGFKFHNSGQLFLDYSDYGTIHFSLYLPFYDKNLTKTTNCSCTDYLPKFFLTETIPVQKIE